MEETWPLSSFNLRHTLAEDEIRILEFDAAQSQSSGYVACLTKILKLASICKGENRTYATLSYVWGDPGVTSRILCDAAKIHVTISLADALSTIWKTHPSTLLWADALSIT
ncbi:hypothetical protein F5884DRAFT_151132 [Xylogone sp. PMI_703]|nr:hypothetical protein F5884DRAFT_151132 [Xylogone sp. PMI_703]